MHKNNTLEWKRNLGMFIQFRGACAAIYPKHFAFPHPVWKYTKIQMWKLELRAVCMGVKLGLSCQGKTTQWHDDNRMPVKYIWS